MVKEHSNTKGYFDIIEIPLDDLIDKTSVSVDDYFYLKDLQQRKLFLTSEICQESVADIIHSILQFNKEDRDIPVEDRNPILLYVSTNGGELDAGLSVIDAIKLSKTPVYTINTSNWYSMGLYIGMSGHKRFAFPNATFLLHDGSTAIGDSSSKVDDFMKFKKKLDQRLKEFTIANSKIDTREYNRKARAEYYMFAEEAREKGFIDAIIGDDCELDDII